MAQTMSMCIAICIACLFCQQHILFSPRFEMLSMQTCTKLTKQTFRFAEAIQSMLTAITRWNAQKEVYPEICQAIDYLVLLQAHRIGFRRASYCAEDTKTELLTSLLSVRQTKPVSVFVHTYLEHPKHTDYAFFLFRSRISAHKWGS